MGTDRIRVLESYEGGFILSAGLLLFAVLLCVSWGKVEGHSKLSPAAICQGFLLAGVLINWGMVDIDRNCIPELISGL